MITEQWIDGQDFMGIKPGEYSYPRDQGEADLIVKFEEALNGGIKPMFRQLSDEEWKGLWMMTPEEIKESEERFDALMKDEHFMEALKNL